MISTSRITSASISEKCSKAVALDRPSRGFLDFSAVRRPASMTVRHGRLAGLADDDAPRDDVQYEERYIAFIDILGFKELILESAKANPRVTPSTIYNALDIHPQAVQDFFFSLSDVPAAQHDCADLRVHTFSDFVVASCRQTDLGLCLLLFLCWHVTSDWLSKSFLSRGGITIGKVIHRISAGDAPLVFGPAFVQAYTLESEVADYPRIVLSKEVRRHYRAVIASTSTVALPLRNVAKTLIRRCEDGPWCIDIFSHLRRSGLAGLGREHDIEARQFQEALKAHLDEATDTPHIYRKVRWLVDGFNRAIDKSRYAGNSIDEPGG